MVDLEIVRVCSASCEGTVVLLFVHLLLVRVHLYVCSSVARSDLSLHCQGRRRLLLVVASVCSGQRLLLPESCRPGDDLSVVNHAHHC